MSAEFISILDMGSERAVADLAVSILEQNPDEFRSLLDLCFLEQYPLSMRAARVLQLYCEKYPESIYPHLDEVLDSVIASKIDGVKRNFLKIFSEFIDIGRIPEPGPLLNACFAWLQDPAEKPALRIHAMGVIFRLAETEPEILHELAASLEMISESTEPSLRGCARKMMKRLESRQSGTRYRP